MVPSFVLRRGGLRRGKPLLRIFSAWKRPRLFENFLLTFVMHRALLFVLFLPLFVFGVFFMSYSLSIRSDQDFFLDSLDLSLSDREVGLCEGEVTLEECLTALSSFKCNKSPGIDGLPYGFYQCFWDILGSDLVDVFNDCLSRGSLSFSQWTGLITLLYKKNDTLVMKNWHPNWPLIGLLRYSCCGFHLAFWTTSLSRPFPPLGGLYQLSHCCCVCSPVSFQPGSPAISVLSVL